MKKLLIANWKMNPATRASVDDYVRDFVEEQRTFHESDDVAFWIAPPSLYVRDLVDALSPEVFIGAQDVSEEEQGARTGEISAAMMADTGASFAIIGHSERRAFHGEDNGMVAKKVLRALESGLRTVVCVGESREERDRGRANDVVARQVRECLEGIRRRQEQNPTFGSGLPRRSQSLTPRNDDNDVVSVRKGESYLCEESATKQSQYHAQDCPPTGRQASDFSEKILAMTAIRHREPESSKARRSQHHARDDHSRIRKDSLVAMGGQNILIAYEPVWAIGSGTPPSAAEIRDMRDVIRGELATLFGEGAKSIRILYGGSVTSENAWETIVAPTMDGALIGGASLEAREFVEIGSVLLDR